MKMSFLAHRYFAVGLMIMSALSILVMSLSGCGSSDGASGSVADVPVEESRDGHADADYAVTIDACASTSGYDGSPAIIVDYSFTNNSEESKSFATACHAKAFQNGVELESAIVADDLGNGYMAEIKPGATTVVRLAYALTDQSEVTVEVEELFSFSDELLAEKVFTIA